MSESDIKLKHISVCTNGRVDSESELAEFVESVQDVTYTQELPNREIYIDPSELEEFEIKLSNGTLAGHSGAEKSEFLCEIHPEDQRVHTHSYVDPELLEDLIGFHEEMLSYFEQAEFAALWFIFETSPVDELPEVSIDLPGLGPITEETSSVRFELDGYDMFYRFNDEETSITFHLSDLGEVAPNNITDEVNRHLEEATDQINIQEP